MTKPAGDEDSADEKGEGVDAFVALVESTSGMQPGRRVFHVVCGLLVAAIALWLPVPGNLLVGGLAVAFVGSLAMDLTRLYYAPANQLFYKVFPSFLTPRDAHQLASSTWYVLGLLLVFLFFPLRTAVAATLVLAVADPAGNVVGRTIGKRRFGTGTVEGTLALIAAAFLATVGLMGVVPATAGAIVTGFVETRDVPLDDNLTVPVAAALTFWVTSLLLS